MYDLFSCLTLTFSDAVVLQPKGATMRPNFITAHALVRRVPHSRDWMFTPLLHSGDDVYTSGGFTGDADAVSRVAEYQMGSMIHECDVVAVCYNEETFPSNLQLH